MFDRHASDQIESLLDGEISGAERSRVEAHLETCARCRKELEQVQIGRDLLRNLRPATAPAGLWQSIEEAAYDNPRSSTGRFWTWRLATAAMVAALVWGGYAVWSRQPIGDWQVIATRGAPRAGSQRISASQTVRSGQWLHTDQSSKARILVADVGSVDVEPGTDVRLLSTGASGHRLSLSSGTIRASITAPPRLFIVDTPAATAVDLGCEYRLDCSREGDGTLRVTAGWVALEWKGRESLVPAGASCRMYAGRGTGTPWFDDASAPLVTALHDLDRGAGDALPVVLKQARSRDTLSLWHLLSSVDAGRRSEVYNRMVVLAPLPAGVSRQQVLELHAESLRRWKEELAWTW